MQELDTLSLIGQRYLDTQFDDECINSIEDELRKRKVVGLKRLFYEYFAASSLWWNIIWWEWIELNLKDMLIGWLSNLILFSIIGALLWLFINLPIALLVVFLMHVFTTIIGIGLWKGSKRSGAK